jgi:putative transposase
VLNWSILECKDAEMPGPKPPEIVLTIEEHEELERLVRGHTTGQQVAVRARIVLLAADGLSTEAIARRLSIDADTVRLWRARWRTTTGSAAARVADAPKSGRPARITPEQICRIIALACEIPAGSDRPISQWSARELADEIIHRGIVDHLSPRHAGRLLKSGRPQAPFDPLLAHSGSGRGRSGSGGADC